MEARSLGDGHAERDDFGARGPACVIEPGVRIFGPGWIHLGASIYLGHDAYLRAYPQGRLEVGDGCWIGPGCFINSFGGVSLGRRVGLGPGVKILTSEHAGGDPRVAVIDWPLKSEAVAVDEGADIGAGAVLLPGSHVGAFARVGAGAVVTGRVAAGEVVAGVPARPIGSLQETK